MARCHFSVVGALIALFISYVSALSPPGIGRRKLIGTEEDEAVADFPGSKFHNFLSRPDIKAPKFRVKFYDKSALAPGYWFVAPYHNLEQSDTSKPWVGSYIYDNDGEVVWSGAQMFKHYNAFDFKVTQFNGQDMLSLKYAEGDAGAGVIFDNTYQIRQEVFINPKRKDMHEFNVVDGGAHALVVTSTEHRSTVKQAQAIGLKFNQTCQSLWKGFSELDTKTSKPVFEWDARDHIGLDESTKVTGAYKDICQHNWDILHINAVDKFPDGDYLISARHTDALYKISHTDGAIVWRLGGTKSDFKLLTDDAKFSRQHHSTVRGQNETHILVGLFDNAIGTGSKSEKPSHKNSRGLLLSLDLTSMTASVAGSYDHPLGLMTNSRGSFQTLPNGNAFMGWTYHTRLSEHIADGKLIMEATLKLPGHCYRNYKFPWVGHPTQPPDVYSTVVRGNGRKDPKIKTMAYVSWNGATEVHTWVLHRSDNSGFTIEPVASMPRQGFETALVYNGYASHVVAEALDSNGNSLGKSLPVKTIADEDLDLKNHWVAEDVEWLQEQTNLTIGSIPISDESVVSFFVGFAASVILSIMAFAVWRWRPKASTWWQNRRASYKPISPDEESADTADLESEERKVDT